MRNALYGLAGAVSAALLALIFIATMIRVVGRLFGIVVPGADDFSGLFLAGSSFLGLAYTLRYGGHVRVMMLLEKLGGRNRRRLEVAACVTACVVTAALAYYAAYIAYDSYEAGEYTLGYVPVALWLPQAVMFVGILALCLAFLDMLYCYVSGRDYYVTDDTQVHNGDF